MAGGPTLPQFQTKSQDLSLMQNSWAKSLNPILQNPSLQSLLIKDVALSIGDNIINHRLGRMQQGWRICDIDGAAVIYRSAPLNALTLTLNSDAAVTVSIEVF